MDKVVHFEIPANDTERAKRFYSIFGWKFNDIPDMKYIIVHTVETGENNMPKEAGAINGGIYNRADGGSKTPVIVINVTSIDKSVKKVEGHGGKIFMPKRQVWDMGFYTQVKDTEGNIIGLWENIKKA